MDSTQLVNDLIAITTRLVMVMTAEIEKLRAHDIKGVETLQSEKAGLARAYETLIRELRKHPGLLQDVAPALRDELVTAANDFQRLLLENEAALRAAKDVNNRVLKAIADAVTESRKETATYSRAGTADLGKLGRGAAPVCVTLDRML
jgi:flagellar biosynthesis/type III secretory pathway chaperone